MGQGAEGLRKETTTLMISAKRLSLRVAEYGRTMSVALIAADTKVSSIDELRVLGEWGKSADASDPPKELATTRVSAEFPREYSSVAV
ncbi:unnamed protein product [Nippostrongylus brasiliensis]|uniref:Rad51 domain-containing protein n=1 Tax=Nippostrongylus brasiliensis TaxID=27835 RepID=A0A0N4XCA4_NIPBR|nr:unnamed protein product [Nippostrongylus brasiliensis]